MGPLLTRGDCQRAQLSRRGEAAEPGRDKRRTRRANFGTSPLSESSRTPDNHVAALISAYSALYSASVGALKSARKRHHRAMGIARRGGRAEIFGFSPLSGIRQ